MIKTVEIDRELERHDVMLKSVDKSLKKTKKKLHKYELTLQNQPDLEFAHPEEFVEFDKKLYQNLFSDKPAALPSLRKLQNDHKIANPHPIYLSTGEVILSKEARNAIEADRLSRKVSTRCIDALNEIRKNKHFGKSRTFGTEAEGEVLKVLKIKNPKDEFDEVVRVLTRKVPIHDTSELLGKATEGCGPLQNVDMAAIPLFQKKDSNFQLPFKSSARNPPESAAEKKERLLKRRGADSSPTRKLSPLRERNFSRSMDQRNLTPFAPMSGESSIGHRSPISTIRSPGKCNIFPRGFPKDPLQVKIEDRSPTSDDGEEINFAFDLSNHDGKYYFGDTSDFIKSVTKESRTAGKVKHVDYTMGALVNRSKGAVFRASQSASSFSYGEDDTISDRSMTMTLEIDGEVVEKEGKEKSAEQQLLDLASPTATGWALQKNKSAFGSPKVAKHAPLQKKKSEGDMFGADLDSTEAYHLPHDLTELRPALKKWYRDNEIYSPIRPQTSKFLSEEKKTKYMAIAPELLLPDDYDGERVSEEDAERMYREFKAKQLQNEEEEKLQSKLQRERDGDDEEATQASNENVHSINSEDLDPDGNLALTELEEMKLYGTSEREEGLRDILGGFGGLGLAMSR